MSIKNLTDVHTAILSLMEKDVQITISDISKTLEMNQSAVQRHIEHLKDAEILKREGGRSTGKWVIRRSDDSPR